MNAVGCAVVQEGVSRVVSFMLRKPEEESRELHNLARLEAVHNRLEFAMERSSKFVITDRSLLCRRKFLAERAVVCGYVLMHKLRTLEDEEMADLRVAEAARSWSSPKRIFSSVKSWVSNLFTSKKDDLVTVQRFEWLAEYADKFVRDVETGCSLWHNTFCNPLVRHLLEGKTLSYQTVQGRRGPSFFIWPIYSEERGVEAQLRYRYDDPETPDRNFYTALLLRLTEATDLVGIATKCLQSWAYLSNLVPEFAMEQLATLAYLQDISHSCGPPWVGIEEEHTKGIRCARPNPLCCKANGKGPCTDNIVSSELSHIFSEQVMFFHFKCCFSVLKYRSAGSSDEADTSVMRYSRTPLQFNVAVIPHFVYEQILPGSHLVETIETLRSKAMKCFLRQQEITYHNTQWRNSKHGILVFWVQDPSTETATDERIISSGYMTRSNKRKLSLDEIGEPHVLEETRTKRRR